MLEYLNHVDSALSGSAELPSREDLLAVLEMDDRTRKNVKNVISFLPPNFPGTRWNETDDLRRAKTSGS